ncbi:hypothetical protein ACWF0M_00655 [Kribbella sp. NPDC055110]
MKSLVPEFHELRTVMSTTALLMQAFALSRYAEPTDGLEDATAPHDRCHPARCAASSRSPRWSWPPYEESRPHVEYASPIS